MDVVGSEIGQKMRSAIKAKLTELGCYVDDELPDYVMVMVANKRTRGQMEEDLQLFLGDNTELFVNWLHQVLKKLQQVSVTAPITVEREKSKERSVSKDRKPKEKKAKEKSKKSDSKKSKKKVKEKEIHKKEIKKAHKKKKSKHHDIIRPNIPPLLMNMEKNSEPSITDVFAGQILKNHGVLIEPQSQDEKNETKSTVKESKKPVVPVIDLATISSEQNLSSTSESTKIVEEVVEKSTESSANRDEQIKEINEIEVKIQGLKQKLVEQLDSMSDDDEDFLNIRTEADELMNDFADEVFQEVSQSIPKTPPLQKKPTSPRKIIEPVPPTPNRSAETVELLPQFELKLPKRPARDRISRDITRKVESKETEKKQKSPERFTPEPEPPQKPTKITYNDQPASQKRKSDSDEAGQRSAENSSKKITSRISVLENRPVRSSCTSVVRVRPRPRVAATASSLLMKAVADAHKSLLNIPPKIEADSQKVKRALVLPMRRMDAQNIVIQVPAGGPAADADDADRNADVISLEMDSNDDESSRAPSDVDKEEYVPASITKKIKNTEYVPSRRFEGRISTKKNDTLIIETINIHNPTVDKDKSTQFIVTMDGYHPNSFLKKKLLDEGILNDEEANKTKESKEPPVEANVTKEEKSDEIELEPAENTDEDTPVKRLSATKDDATEAKIKTEEVPAKRKTTEMLKDLSPPVRKRKASPIVFDVSKKEKVVEKEERQRTESASSDSHIVVTTNNTHKYDAVPPLSQAERKPIWCKAFPMCRYGSTCAFIHPRCKFAASCTRRNCVYSHLPGAPLPLATPSVASHVIPVANYKSISSVAVPGMCKFYPGCVNPMCHFYHPKPCRFGKNCTNKLECNFYHSDVPKWKYCV
ncbi:zinc finger CCCH domain-containing protein 14 isoform X1 [Bombyx mandarina]|uniref:Zinc finger CCCH domain-containing protein 14 n=1 Tax=Bombyx mandarina TaxID=7092 RepID=A0A6J2J715_BOMMA|nr:zinc finger CCCH domain-containing protein 14 isoform X1 [Bombyx mandarina]